MGRSWMDCRRIKSPIWTVAMRRSCSIIRWRRSSHMRNVRRDVTDRLLHCLINWMRRWHESPFITGRIESRHVRHFDISWWFYRSSYGNHMSFIFILSRSRGIITNGRRICNRRTNWIQVWIRKSENSWRLWSQIWSSWHRSLNTRWLRPDAIKGLRLWRDLRLGWLPHQLQWFRSYQSWHHIRFLGTSFQRVSIDRWLNSTVWWVNA